jgi:hypothetical protein
MAEVATLFSLMISLFAVALNIRPRKQKGKKPFPVCFDCRDKKPMVQLAFSEPMLPTEIRQCLLKHNLPLNVVRRFICVRGHKEMWMAPAVTGEQKGMTVSRKTS